MPTYVYRCEQCGHRFEAWQHMTDEPLAMCPKCQGPIHRILFPAGIVFKGSGFYSTDHRPSAVATEPATPAVEKKSESGGESTPSPAPATGGGSESTTPASAKA